MSAQRPTECLIEINIIIIITYDLSVTTPNEMWKNSWITDSPPGMSSQLVQSESYIACRRELIQALSASYLPAGNMPTMWLSDSQSMSYQSKSPRVSSLPNRLLTSFIEVGVAFCSGGGYDHQEILFRASTNEVITRWLFPHRRCHLVFW